MMIGVYFRDELMGVGESENDTVRWTKEKPGLQSVVSHYEKQGLKGESLLRTLQKRLQGNWWTSDEDAEKKSATVKEKLLPTDSEVDDETKQCVVEILHTLFAPAVSGTSAAKTPANPAKADDANDTGDTDPHDDADREHQVDWL